MKDIGKAFAMLTQIGFAMLTPILICILIGVYIDKTFSTSPIFTIIFIIMGVMSSFRSLYMICKKFIDEGK